MARYAWPQFRSEWALSLDDVEVDGLPGHELVDEPNARLRLDSVEWDELSFTATIATTERVPPPLTTFEAFVLASSTRAQTRVPVALLPVERADGLAFGGQVTLFRDELAGSVKLSGTVVSPVGDRLRTVATSDEWTVSVDAYDAPLAPGAPPFKTAWVDFAGPDAPGTAGATPEAHAVMDVGLVPTLYLNSGIDGFRELVHADTARGERRRARELVGSSLARLALAALCRAAVEDVVAAAEDGPQPPQDRLRQQTLEAVAGAMATVASPHELYERLTTIHLDGAEGAALWSEIDIAVDSLTHVPTTVSDVCKAIKYG